MSFLSGFFPVSQPIYINGTAYNATKQAYSIVTTSGGKATFYLTDNGLAGGNALFTNIFPESVQCTGWSTNRVLLFSNPVISGDKKTVTVDVNYNTSLLSLGLVPFAAAADGFQVSLSVAGV